MKIKGKEIVGQFLNSADQGSPEFMRLWNMLVWGLKTEFNLDITGTFKTVIIDVNANKTAPLPCDYITYSKIGQLNDRGEVVTYKKNTQLSTLITGVTDNRVKGAPIVRGAIKLDGFYNYNTINYLNYFNNGVTYRLYGADSGTPKRGEYKVDEDQGLIFLSLDTVANQIVLEYLSSGFEEECCDYSIDVQAAECMKTYLRWQNAIDMPKKYSQSQIEGYKREFYRTKRITKVRVNPFVLNEMQDAIRVGQKLTAKS